MYENYTGVKPEEKNILVLDIPKIISENKNKDYDVIPGLLGEKLKEAHIPVTLLGNADTFEQKNRPAGFIIMDTRGIIEKGEIGTGLLRKDINSPYLVQTDYDRLYNLFLHYKEQGGLLVIHLGDTIRADNYANNVSVERYTYFREKALRKADDFLGKLLTALDLSKDLLMVVTPYPSSEGYKNNNLLTPFFLVGSGVEKGYAFSATTRRPGLITNLDVAPTILSFFDVTIPSLMLGNPVEGYPAQDTFASLLLLNKQIVSTYTQRATLIKPYVGFQVILSLIFLLFLFFKKNWLNFLRPLIIAGMSIPFVFLVLGKIAGDGLGNKYFWLIIFTLLIVMFTHFLFKKNLTAIAFLCLVTSGGIIIDLILGAPLMKVSMLGYDPIGGSRYYGLGNEYMGVLIGSLVIGCMVLLDLVEKKKRIRPLIFVLFLITFYLILSPSYGSNVGGTISAFGAFSVTLLLSYGVKFRIKHFLVLSCGLLITIIILFLVVAPLSPPSHISQTVEVIKEGGISSAFLIIVRKLTMNYKLIRYTIWTRGLLAFLVVIAALLYRPPFILKRIFNQNTNLYIGCIGAGVGCLLAFIFNDSGVVAAATMMIYVALPVFLLVINQ